MGWFKRRSLPPPRRVLVIGLDCLEPSLAFERYAQEMPVFSGLMRQGAHGLFESVIPPITVPAWACMTTGRQPGELGIYGFRNRIDHSYDRLSIVTSASVQQPAVWDHLSQAGRRSIVVGVPPGFPPKPFNGLGVGCFLTPDAQAAFTHPASLKGELQALVGEYQFDVRNFRTEDKQWLLDQIYQLTAQRFRVASHLMATQPWDFFMFVDMGPDRLHHGFWKYADPDHIHHVPGNPFQNAMREYYRFLDEQLGRLLERVGDDTAVLVVSDHGAKRMDGGICINEWLMREGYLTLKAPPQAVCRVEAADVDWPRTAAWGEGGYYSRIFLNVAGREPLGRVAPSEADALCRELISKLEALGDEHGRPIGTRVFRPEDLYPVQRGVCPDLIALFGDLHWRSVGTVGWGTVWVHENDTGPDDANHAQHGVWVAVNWPGARGRQNGLRLPQLAGSVLDLLGVETPLPRFPFAA